MNILRLAVTPLCHNLSIKRSKTLCWRAARVSRPLPAGDSRTGLLTLLLAPWYRANTRFLGFTTLVGIAMTAASLVKLWSYWHLNGPQETAYGMVRIDGFGLFFSFIVLLVGMLSVLYSMKDDHSRLPCNNVHNWSQ